MAFGETPLFTEETFEREGQPTLFDNEMLATVALADLVEVDLT